MSEELPEIDETPLREWKQHPMTQRFLQYLFFCREANKEDWAKGVFQGDDLQAWALKNAKALGGVDMIDQILNVDMATIIGIEKEAHEHIRNQSRRLDSAG